MARSVQDLVGNKYGRLTVVARAPNSRTGIIRWECACSCGGSCVSQGSALKNGHTSSCGCAVKEKAAQVGSRFRKSWFPVYAEGFCRVPLSRGQFALVDTEDVPLIKNFSWYLSNTGYACGRKPGSSKVFMMHRLILGVGKEGCVDHVSMDTLDNRRRNLRVASHSQNAANSKNRKNNSSGYKGVSFDKRTGRWRAIIERDGNRVCLGRFLKKEDAAREYDSFSRELDGSYARLNFSKEGERSCQMA